MKENHAHEKDKSHRGVCCLFAAGLYWWDFRKIKR